MNTPGAVLLYASLRKPKELVGVDLFPEVFELTKQNLERYEVHANLHACKIQDYHDELFDVIACNPPYFSTTNQDLMNVNQYKGQEDTKKTYHWVNSFYP